MSDMISQLPPQPINSRWPSSHETMLWPWRARGCRFDVLGRPLRPALLLVGGGGRRCWSQHNGSGRSYAADGSADASSGVPTTPSMGSVGMPSVIASTAASGVSNDDDA